MVNQTITILCVAFRVITPIFPTHSSRAPVGVAAHLMRSLSVLTFNYSIHKAHKEHNSTLVLDSINQTHIVFSRSHTNQDHSTIAFHDALWYHVDGSMDIQERTMKIEITRDGKWVGTLDLFEAANMG